MAGHRVYGPDSIGELTKANSTTVQLAASSVTLGGLQYDTAILQALTPVSGVGGIDTGSVASNAKYYVYVVLDGSDAALIMSLSSSAPTGFSIYKKVGTIKTDYVTALLESSIPIQSMEILIGTNTGVDVVAATTSYKKRILFGVNGDLFGDITNDKLLLDAGEYIMEMPMQGYGDCDWLYMGLWDGSSYIFDKIIGTSAGGQPHKGYAVLRHRFTLTSSTTLEVHTKVSNGGGTSERIFDGMITKINKV